MSPKSPGTGGGSGKRAGGGALGRTSRARAAVVAKARDLRDKRNAKTVDKDRANVRKAPARKAARRALWRSAARMHARRLLAATLAAPLGVLGMLTTPLGRKLGWQWLQHPGRRLYQRMANKAKQEKTERDAAIRAQLEQEEAAADAVAEQDPAQIGDQVERPAPLIPTTAPTPVPAFDEGGIVSGFRFEEHAAEMQFAAMQYDPDGCMEILAMVEGLPQALAAVAHVMQILAERSDSEFPLEKEVAAGFNDIYDLLMKAAAGAEELPAIFRRVHEQDIARHEDPRNGHDAEKGWNV
ncbi:hypothetical protein ACWCQE_18475 [Streptomyces sp. NPDC002409]